jgi:hypothetical protein
MTRNEKQKTKLQIQENKKNKLKKTIKLVVAAMPPMVHLVHKQIGEEILNKGGEFETNNEANKQTTKHASKR